MTETIMVALITGGLGLMGVVIRQLANFRTRDLAAHELLESKIDGMEHANRTAHTAVQQGQQSLAAELHEHRIMTEAALDGLNHRVEDIHEQAREREAYWRKRGETVTEKVARLEAFRETLGD